MRWLEPRAGKAPQRGETVQAQMDAALDAAGRGDHAAALAIWGPLGQAGVPRAQGGIIAPEPQPGR